MYISTIRVINLMYPQNMLANYMNRKQQTSISNIFIQNSIFHSKQQFSFKTIIVWVLNVIVLLLAFMRFEFGFFRKRS